MTKKFSTLMAGLLLAGGVFTSVNAENLAELAEKAPGRYFEIIKNANYENSAWSADETGDWHLVWTSDGVVYSNKNVQSDRNNSVWTVAGVEGKEGYFTLTTKNGKKLSVTLGDAVISEFKITNYNKSGSVLSEAETNCLTFKLNADEYYLGIDVDANSDGSYNVACNKAGENYAKGFDAEEVQLAYNMTVADVNSFLGKREGFKLSIGYLKDNDPKKITAYNPLEGNVFAGVLKAKGKQNATTFNLVNEEGKYLVLTRRDWNNQNTKIGNKFTLMTAQELADQKVRDGVGGLDEEDPVILSTDFQISNNEYNGYIEVAAVYTKDTESERVELLVSGYNNVNYLTVGDDAVAKEPDFNNNTNRTYVKFGADNLVDMPSFAQKVYYSFINSKGEVAGANCNNDNTFGTYFQKEAQADMPEGQWLLSDVTNTEAVFSNRESKQTFNIARSSFYTTDEEGVYEIAGHLYTINTVAFEDADNGYEDFGDTRLKNFNIGLYSPIWNGVLNLVENHASVDHQIGLDAEAATVWNLIPNAAEATYNKNTGNKTAATDTVYVENKYVLYKSSDGTWTAGGKDTLKVVSYLIQNAQNGEYIAYNSKAKGQFYYCSAKAAKAFAFKKVGDSYNMVEVNLGAKATDDAKIEGGKIYGGDSATKGLLSNVDCIYDRTENDLFKVKLADIALYRRIENGLDTISIYRAENAHQLLFETGGFLGWANDKQFEFAPAMLADTAYVEEGAIRPQYMLVVGKPVVTKGTNTPCSICGSMDCEHSTSTYDTVEGRYLVNLKDSAIAFDNKNIHAVNPYTNTEGYYRLGFVEAKRVNKTLTIASTGKKLNIGTPDYNEAKFAFRYVNEAEGTFKIETADFVKEEGDNRGKMMDKPGYVKTMNGVIVVVSDANDADIFNMNEDEDRNPTANEGVEAAAVKVIATEGAVIVKGAEGKKVVISNVLGQTIANTTVASSEATIAAPQGVVVVAVEGEAAVKAIVK